LAQAVFEPNLFPYKYPSNLILVTLPAFTTYDDATECSEMLAYKIQAPGNYTKETIQHVMLYQSFIYSPTGALVSCLKKRY